MGCDSHVPCDKVVKQFYETDHLPLPHHQQPRLETASLNHSIKGSHGEANQIFLQYFIVYQDNIPRVTQL